MRTEAYLNHPLFLLIPWKAILKTYILQFGIFAFQDMKIEVIDLFCGIGGLTHGLRQADMEVLAGLDNDETCRYAYEENNKDSKFICADISQYDFNKLKEMYSEGSLKVLVGCAPCQPFSSHTFKAKDKQNDKRWHLINYFLEAIKVIKPEVVSMENVRGITKTELFKDFVNELKELKYKVNYDVVYCPDYGIPQNRSRLVLMASLLGELNVPKKTHEKNEYKKVKDIIHSLPKIKSGEADCSDPVHKAKNLSPLNIRRIKQSKPNGSWKDWNPELLPKCYIRATGSTYTAVYGRMDWDSVSPTITTQFYNYGSGRFGHPQQDRALSLREGALLQTFPIDYKLGEVCLSRLGRHIGNAVPPKLGFAIGVAIKRHFAARRILSEQE